MLLALVTVAGCFDGVDKPKNSVGFVVTEQCLPDLDKDLKNFEADQNIRFKQLPVNNGDGSYYVMAKRYVLLSSDSYSQNELIATMNGILKTCGLDSTISIDLKGENADQKVKALFGRLVQNPELQEGITFSIQDSMFNMHQNSETPKF